MSRPVVQVEELRKVYGAGTVNETHALKGLNFTVNRGEFVAITGQSGCGKSTLLNILGTLDRASSGTVKLDGSDVAELSESELARFRNRTIGFVFQFHHLLYEFNVLENVLMPVSLRKGTPEQEDVDFAMELLGVVGLSEQAHKRANKISGGQQQRAAIVRALVNRPPVVLADEPTGNLDSRLGDDVFRLMRRLTQELGITFLMVTHNNDLAKRADRIIALKDGLVVTPEPAASKSERDRLPAVTASYQHFS